MAADNSALSNTSLIFPARQAEGRAIRRRMVAPLRLAELPSGNRSGDARYGACRRTQAKKIRDGVQDAIIPSKKA